MRVGEGGGLRPEARHGGGPHHRLWARVEVGHGAAAEIGSGQHSLVNVLVLANTMLVAAEIVSLT